MRRATLLLAPLLAACALLAACGQGEETHEFSDIRDRTKPRSTVPPNITAAQRYGYRDPRAMGPHGGDPHGGNPHGGDPHAGMAGMGHGGTMGAGAKPFTWKTPDGWEEVKGSSSRDGSWRVKGEPQTDISLSKLRGTGGGMLLNVNRWRKQMGAADLDQAALDALPKLKVLDRDAVYVNIPGRYGGGMGSKGASIEDARMLGVVLTLPTAAIFVKFTGPSKVVEANQAKFEQLVASIEMAAHGGAAPPAQPAPKRGGLPSFTWTIPESWEQRKGRMGRVVTVAPKGAKETDCYLYLLGGDGGGIDLNINRWRGQMGQKPLTPEEIAGLERVDALGTKAVLMKAGGAYGGQSGENIQGATLYGAVILKDSYLLTVKMRGPASELEGEWDNFVAFLRSVKEK